MSVQKFVLSKESSNFTTLSNNIITHLKKDTGLLGFYTYLLHLPPSWVFYKSSLQSECNLGRKKLETYLNTLAQMNLVRIAQMRDAQGKFAHFDMIVLNGSAFKIIDLDKKQPRAKNRATVNRSTVKNTYKYNKQEIKDNINKTKSLYCASDDARQKNISSFNNFWKIYPKKRDKVRAEKEWIKNNLFTISEVIMRDIENRIKNDAQWTNKDYIPYPSTYLQNKRWEDELTYQPAKSNLSNGEHALNKIKEKFRQNRSEKDVTACLLMN